MKQAPEYDDEIGIAVYTSDADGVGGYLRDHYTDFKVREIEDIDLEPLDADSDDYPYLIIRVTLKNWDTNQFARELSNKLGISRERVSWAGTKDKRAITHQLFSLKKITPEQLPTIPNTSIEPQGRLGRPLLFGDLLGNEFHIHISKPRDPKQIENIRAELCSFGSGTPAVPNFFGHQRFGSNRQVTHKVGFDILDRDWQQAVMRYLTTTSTHESDRIQEIRNMVKHSKDWKKGLDKFPNKFQYERALLHELQSLNPKNQSEYRQVLEVLPSNLQKLFIHAAQSFLFNRIVSQRLQQHEDLVLAMEGDIVCFTDQTDTVIVPDTDRIQRVKKRQLDTINRHCKRQNAFVTAPLIGTETRFSDGIQGEIERSVLNEYNITQTDFDLPAPYYSEGTRRAMLVYCPFSFSYSPLEVDFSLPKGAYATILLREIMKTSPQSL